MKPAMKPTDQTRVAIPSAHSGGSPKMKFRSAAMFDL